ARDCPGSRHSVFLHASAPADLYTLSLHTLFRSRIPASTARDFPAAGPAVRQSVSGGVPDCSAGWNDPPAAVRGHSATPAGGPARSEEHTSELQSRENLVCRLLLEKKKNNN